MFQDLSTQQGATIQKAYFVEIIVGLSVNAKLVCYITKKNVSHIILNLRRTDKERLLDEHKNFHHI